MLTLREKVAKAYHEERYDFGSKRKPWDELAYYQKLGCLSMADTIMAVVKKVRKENSEIPKETKKPEGS